MTLQIGIDLPEDHITQKCSVFGVTGTGKSNGIGVLLEEYCKKQLPFVMVDVLGAHYGLAEKYEVVVYGGKHGEELEKDQGSYMANVVRASDEHKVSVIFDMSEWNDFEMQEWMVDFLNEIFDIHARDRVPRHIFVEEAEVFFPQVNYDSGKFSLLAGNKVMKRGRALGLGMTLISQRPQDVNKKTLSQSQCNFLMHLEGVPEMKVVKEMLRSETKEARDGYIRMITDAKQGDCLLYSPQWLGKIEGFKFRLKETFHSGYTPKLNEVVVEPKLKGLVRPILFDEDSMDNKNINNSNEPMSSGKVLVIGISLAIVLYWITSAL